MARQTIRLGTRGSNLARWQTDHVMEALQQHFPEIIFEIVTFTTQGDRVLDTDLPLIGGKGLFTAELEAALYEGKIDLAVHSLKDLPTEMPQGLKIGAILTRANPADVLVTHDNVRLDGLPMGSVIGTSSRRRAAQLLHRRPDLEIADIRGNVETRIRKVKRTDGSFDGTLLAYAGLERLRQLEVINEVFDFEVMMPAPGQGALAVQCRDDETISKFLAKINDPKTYAEVEAERAFLGALGGGCAVPIAAFGEVAHEKLHLRGRVTAMDGSTQIDVMGDIRFNPNDPSGLENARGLGQTLAQDAIQQGAAAILEALHEG